MASHHTPTILVVDDELPILDALEDLFEDDFRVLTANSGRAGLELLDSREISAVLSDQRMPGMKGEEFLARVAERSIATRVLLTGYTDFEDLVKAVNRGQIYAFVPKPWSSPQLRSVVLHAVERYELQRKLLQEKALLEALMTHTPDLISIKDSQGRYVRVNHAYATALGADEPGRVLGKTDQQWGRPLFRDELSRSEELLHQRPEIDVTRRAEATSRWYSTTRVLTPETSSGSSFLLEISRDITERLETSRRIEEHSARLETINERLSRVSYIVAHHLQEPLRAIGSFVNLLDRRGLLKPGSEEYIGYVRSGVGRAKALMRDFSTYLDLFQPTPKSRISLAQVAEEAKEELSLRHPDSTISVRGDAVMDGSAQLIGRLLFSLLDNAMTHAGTESPVEVSIEAKDGWVHLCVEDQGPGIADEDRKAVLDLFETRSSGTGSGLGLALCQRIAEQHEGQLWLENGSAGGLRVCARLAQQATADEETVEARTGRETGLDRETPSAELRAQLTRVKSFASTAAHDLQEPLRIISGYLSLLERREGAVLSSEGREFLEYSLKAAKRMRQLIDGLLAYSVSGRPTRGQLRPLHDVLADVCADLAWAVSERQAVIDIDEALARVNIWDLEGRQLLSNLIGNSLKYHSQETSVIRVTVESLEQEHLVSVEDNGIGVREELRQSIFEPFVRGDHDEILRGTGLGLATCARIVAGWKGRIWCEASPSGGSRFVFTLPIR